MTLRVSAAHFKRFVIMETVATLALVAGAIDRFAGVPVFEDPMLGWFAIAGGLVLSAAAAISLINAPREQGGQTDQDRSLRR